jgi:UDP:flavonoid glycosyltransferase YjiC (YdhE family)
MGSNWIGETFRSTFKPIIYVSMGTVFNNENSNLFQVLVEACKYYAKDYSVIVSTGDVKTYDKYVKSSLNSSNILLVPHTPQVEILKRAHLFITHAGMNSVSEAVNYGVPIICLPLSGDQPFVAFR